MSTQEADDSDAVKVEVAPNGDDSSPEKEQRVSGILIGVGIGLMVNALLLLGLGKPAAAMWVSIFSIVLVVVGSGLVEHIVNGQRHGTNGGEGGTRQQTRVPTEI